MDKKKTPDVSARASEMPASPIRKFIPLADAAKKRGIKVYHLNIGQPDIPTPPEFMNAVRSYDKKVLEYGNSKGDPNLMQGWVDYYQRRNINVETKDIVVTTGGSEALIFTFICCADVGDEIVVFEPFYTNYNSFARMADVKLVPITTLAEDGFHLPDKKEIEKKITKKAKAILISSPSNPTGKVYTKEELEVLAEICRTHNLFLLSDEVYREFVYEGKVTSVFHLKDIEERGILLDSISKRYSACGARVGCLVSKNQKIMESALKLAQARLCSPSIEQFAAHQATRIPDEYFEKMALEYKRRRDVAYEELMKIPGAVCVKPSGAFYLMAKLPISDIDVFTQWMLTDFNLNGETTMIAPGPGFYATPGKGRDEARIAYVLNVEDLRKAMVILKAGIEAYNRKK